MTDEWTKYTNDMDERAQTIAEEYERLQLMRQYFERHREKSRRRRLTIATVLVTASWLAVGAAIGYAVVEHMGWGWWGWAR